MEAFDSLRADISRNKAAIKVADPALKKALGDLWDWNEGLVDAVDEQLEDHGETLDEIIDGEGEMLHGETAAIIIEELTLGGLLAGELAKRLPPGDPLHERIAAYGVTMTEIIQRLGDITRDDVDEVDPAADGADQEEGADVDE